ncbi:transcriptional regulator [Paenibacillus albiflavus]|uniref:Transcriptional regulator n=1 Tax=Paenibacillus albiflavus TaxID=2545760 RepID=A0A4R4EAA1_9BACL|nr:helix-turn-helix domain-containing protein [Paenibacillus albiflavus]TCZ76794.1 transcriptional regulator [Paenibacillus albiflavus]
MKHSKADLLLHPIRLRIVQIFATRPELTIAQVAEYLKDVPQATLYRHVNQLVQGNMLTVVKQNQVRGTVEKVYSLAKGGLSTSSTSDEETRESMMQQFMLFVAMLIDDFEAYTKRKGEIDPYKDGIGFRQASFYLTDKELQQLYMRIGEAFQEAARHEPSPERQRRTISTILMPGRETNETQEQ